MTNKLNINKLKEAIKDCKASKLTIASDIGISRVTLDKLLDGKEIGLHKFLKVIDYLDKNIGYFFDEDIIIEEYKSYGERGILARKIGKVDQREIETSNAELAKLKAENDKLKEDLLNAKSEIIDLMKKLSPNS